MTGGDFARQLDGYRLTLAEILYARPDAPALLQLFVWQDYDRPPDFPMLVAFLDHWHREIEAALHSVRIAHDGMIGPARWRAVDGVIAYS